MGIPARSMTDLERLNNFVEAAFMARDHARACRKTAKSWPANRHEWIEHDLGQAIEAFRRAQNYLQQARLLKGYQ